MSMALCKTSVLKIYSSIIEDVITNVRDIFTDEGLDEQMLQELKMLWESKLMATKAVKQASDVPEVKVGNYKSEAMDKAVYNVPVQKTQYVNTNQMLLPPSMGAPSTSTATVTEEKLIPIQITLPEHATPNSPTRILTIHVPASALNGPQLHTLLTGSVITATMGLPASLATSLLQQHVNAALQLQNQKFQQQVMVAQSSGGNQQQTVSSTNNGVKLDGGVDSSDDEEEGYGDKTSEEEDDDDKDDDPEEMEDQANEGESPNSDDDITDEEPSDLFDTDNVVVCQYDKITRNRNKWKFHLKDGIMNLQGEDYLFQKANGDAEW